ncbi:MAG: hypothetical protein ACLFS3_01960 [Candidatus Aenigmatarchaeota archaeon]
MEDEKIEIKVCYEIGEDCRKELLDYMKGHDVVSFSDIREYMEDSTGSFDPNHLRFFIDKDIVKEVRKGDFGPCGQKKIEGYTLNPDLEL